MPNDFLADLERSIPELASNLTRSSSTSSTSSPAAQPIACDDPAEAEDFTGRLLDPVDAERYILGGKATITLRSVKTGNRFTYRITAAPDGGAFFVGLLNGPDNTADYKYLGRIARSIFWEGRKQPKPGDIGRDAPSMKAFSWAWRAIVSGTIPAQLEVWHAGQCGRCSRKLTRPESIKHGFGPECWDKVGLAGMAEDFGS